MIYANEYNNFGSSYGMRIFEVRVAQIDNADEITDLKLTQEGNAVAGGDAVTVKVTPLSKIGEEKELSTVSNIELTCDDANVTIKAGENGSFSVSAANRGSYTLKATAIANGNTVEGSMTLNVAFNWNGVENVATGKDVKGRVKADAEDANPVANAVDGDEATYYLYNGEWGGGDSWVLVDLGDEYSVDAIGVYYSNEAGSAGGQFNIGYATDAAAIEAKIQSEGQDFAWKDGMEGWTFTSALTRVVNTINTQAYDKPVVARYIAVRDNDNPGGKPCVREIYVAGTKREAIKATKIEVSASDNGVIAGTEIELSGVVLDQYDGVMADKTVSFSCDTEGVLSGNKFSANEIGQYTIKATCDDLSTDYVVSVVTKDEYKFTTENDPIKHTLTVTEAEVKSENTFHATVGTAAVEFTNVFPATMEYEFAEPRSFAMLSLAWEAACPTNYTVVATYEDGTSSAEVTVVNGRDGQSNKFDKIVNSSLLADAENAGVCNVNLNNVKKLKFTINAAFNNDWKIKFFGIDAYGVEAPAALDEIQVEQKAEYGTLILPFDAAVPVGLEIYSVNNSTESNGKNAVLDLVKVEGKIVANTPYIVKGAVNTYTFKGIPENVEDAYTEGWLTGVMKETVAPKGGYVLQNQEGRLAFYLVGTDDITVPAYHAYLSLPEESQVVAFVFNLSDVTGINGIEASDAPVNVYNLNGVLVRKNVKACDALKGLENGIYVVNGVKKAVK